MKLTKKGLLKILGDIVVDSSEYPLSETLDNWNRTIDFDQDDFEGVICLTPDEAKFLKQRVLKATNFRGSLNLTEEEIDMFDAIEKRIEKLETT